MGTLASVPVSLWPLGVSSNLHPSWLLLEGSTALLIPSLVQGTRARVSPQVTRCGPAPG